jgi:hypothetical protein
VWCGRGKSLHDVHRLAVKHLELYLEQEEEEEEEESGG